MQSSLPSDLSDVAYRRTQGYKGLKVVSLGASFYDVTLYSVI